MSKLLESYFCPFSPDHKTSPFHLQRPLTYPHICLDQEATIIGNRGSEADLISSPNVDSLQFAHFLSPPVSTPMVLARIRHHNIRSHLLRKNRPPILQQIAANAKCKLFRRHLLEHRLAFRVVNQVEAPGTCVL